MNFGTILIGTLLGLSLAVGGAQSSPTEDVAA